MPAWEKVEREGANIAMLCLLTLTYTSDANILLLQDVKAGSSMTKRLHPFSRPVADAVPGLDDLQGLCLDVAMVAAFFM